VFALALAGSAIQLVPDGTMLFHLVLIVVMVSLLNATLLRPINRILEERERRTKGSSSEAQTALSNASERIQEYQRSLREARARGYSLMDEERRSASRERDLQVAEVRSEVTRWIDQEKQALKREEEGARVSLVKNAGARALEIGGRILGRSLG
jgi:F-type H+-transporting ATPase subunit b